MKKRSVVNLIRYYSEKNDVAFRNEAESIAKDFDKEGDSEIAGYIMALLSDVNVFMPQMNDQLSSMFEKVDTSGDNLWLPDDIMKSLMGIINAISNDRGVNTFLFHGAPGTGKTEAVKQMARILKKDIFMVNFASIVDSKLGNTAKNIDELFVEINRFPQPKRLIILFDEIDAVALDRTNPHDHREMGRATSEFLRKLDQLKSEVILVATTNLYKHFDKALLRRFDAVISFDRYSEDDIIEIGEKFLDKYLREYSITKKDIRLFRKICSKSSATFSPGEMKNLVRKSIAFSDPSIEGDYFNRVYEEICGKSPNDIFGLKDDGFTVREIALLMGKSKSAVDRELKEGNH